MLVWNLDETALLNVKISDYGISRFATPQGVAGVEGTPGYQAPEIRPGIGYDEKVCGKRFECFVIYYSDDYSLHAKPNITCGCCNQTLPFSNLRHQHHTALTRTCSVEGEYVLEKNALSVSLLIYSNNRTSFNINVGVAVVFIVALLN